MDYLGGQTQARLVEHQQLGGGHEAPCYGQHLLLSPAERPHAGSEAPNCLQMSSTLSAPPLVQHRSAIGSAASAILADLERDGGRGLSKIRLQRSRTNPPESGRAWVEGLTWPKPLARDTLRASASTPGSERPESEDRNQSAAPDRVSPRSGALEGDADGRRGDQRKRGLVV